MALKTMILKKMSAIWRTNNANLSLLREKLTKGRALRIFAPSNSSLDDQSQKYPDQSNAVPICR
jgi:hypothetical protein